MPSSLLVSTSSPSSEGCSSFSNFSLTLRSALPFGVSNIVGIRPPIGKAIAPVESRLGCPKCFVLARVRTECLYAFSVCSGKEVDVAGMKTPGKAGSFENSPAGIPIRRFERRVLGAASFLVYVRVVTADVRGGGSW